MRRCGVLFLLLTCLLLTACGGETEAEGPGAIAYVPQAVPFSSPQDQTESACVFGDALYLLGTVYEDGPGGVRDLSLVRVPLEGGKAQTPPAFRPVRLEADKAYESTGGGFLRPGADGTLWLTEDVYRSGAGVSPVLRQLDGEGNELFRFDGSGLKEDLGAEWIYDLWTDGAGTFLVNTGAASLPERTVLNLSLYPLSDMRDDIARFNRESDSCYISVKEYITDNLGITPAILEQALLRLNADMTTGNRPDLLVLHPNLLRQLWGSRVW